MEKGKYSQYLPERHLSQGNQSIRLLLHIRKFCGATCKQTTASLVKQLLTHVDCWHLLTSHLISLITLRSTSCVSRPRQSLPTIVTLYHWLPEIAQPRAIQLSHLSHGVDAFHWQDQEFQRANLEWKAGVGWQRTLPHLRTVPTYCRSPASADYRTLPPHSTT